MVFLGFGFWFFWLVAHPQSGMAGIEGRNVFRHWQCNMLPAVLKGCIDLHSVRWTLSLWGPRSPKHLEIPPCSLLGVPTAMSMIACSFTSQILFPAWISDRTGEGCPRSLSVICLHALSTGMGALGAQGSPWHTSWPPLPQAHGVSGPWDLSGSFSCTPVSRAGGWQWGAFCKTANLKDPPPGYAPLFTAFPMIPPCSCNNGELLDRLGSPYKLSCLWAPPVPWCVSREFWFTSLGNLVL